MQPFSLFYFMPAWELIFKKRTKLHKGLALAGWTAQEPCECSAMPAWKRNHVLFQLLHCAHSKRGQYPKPILTADSHGKTAHPQKRKTKSRKTQNNCLASPLGGYWEYLAVGRKKIGSYFKPLRTGEKKRTENLFLCSTFQHFWIQSDEYIFETQTKEGSVYSSLL